jgi:hypothetical protein
MIRRNPFSLARDERSAQGGSGKEVVIGINDQSRLIHIPVVTEENRNYCHLGD